MYSAPTIAFKYLRYLLTASNAKGHGIHSPFVFSLVKEVLRAEKSRDVFIQIEKERNKLLLDKTVLPLVDYGAGSRLGNKNQKSVAELARNALKSPKFARLLHYLTSFMQAESALELGTSLGITTSYLAAASGVKKIYTLEGSPAVAVKAKEVFASLGLDDKIELHEGEFSVTLPELLISTGQLDVVFMDGNHRYQPTIDYWQMLQPCIHHHSVIILDDIHWSAEMEQAWEWVKKQPQVTLTIDLFFVGLVFFNVDFKTKQHFTIRY